MESWWIGSVAWIQSMNHGGLGMVHVGGELEEEDGELGCMAGLLAGMYVMKACVAWMRKPVT
jgi:hypothetical protein